MTLTDEQRRFLRLHATAFVNRWQWIFRETLLRAFDDAGNSATISRARLDELERAGLVRRGGQGRDDRYVTDKGMELAA